MSLFDTSPPNIEDAFFAVEERPVGVASKQELSGFKLESKYRAIVDGERGHVFTIVTGDYRLITNKEAVEIGKLCFREVFGVDADAAMTFFNVVMPSTRSYCHLDFLDARDKGNSRPEWIPFLRITNSYNRTRSLRFDIGFCRWICRNGMIFGKQSIEFRYSHTRRDVQRTIAFQASFGTIEDLRRRFQGWIETLKQVAVESEQVPALLCKALEVSLAADRWEEADALQRLHEFVGHVRGLEARYSGELGRNAYAAFNVITDVASRPPAAIGPQSSIDKLQRRASNWAGEFAGIVNEPGFSLASYLEPVMSQARALPAFGGRQP